MKRVFEEAFLYENNAHSNKRARIEKSLAEATFALPKDVWRLVLNYLHIYDTIFIRATNSILYKWCKEFKLFPQFFVLHQDKCMEYLVESGFISCLDYVKSTLRFEWTDQLTSIAARSGQIDTLKHLVNNGLAINVKSILLECTKGTCDIAMVKYLHECGVPWEHIEVNQHRDPLLVCSVDHVNADRTVMESMAYHGHLECMRYAMENGCTQRTIHYTPSIECLDFVIQHGFNWKGGGGQYESFDQGHARFEKRSICEEAARLGNLTILKSAHEKGARLNNSALFASEEGYLDCLVYAIENSESHPWRWAATAKTLDCFKYSVQKRHERREEYIHEKHMWRNQLEVGNLEILRFMLKNGPPCHSDNPHMYQSILSASLSSIELFKFMLDEVKAPFDIIKPYIGLTKYGNIEGLKLAFERNLPTGSDAEEQANDSPQSNWRPLSHTQWLIRNAIKSKNAEVLKFVWEKFPNQECFDLTTTAYATIHSTPEILDFMNQQGAQWLPRHLTAASSSGNLPNMAYLTHIGCEWKKAPCWSSKNPLVIKYAREHGCRQIIKPKQYV